MKLVYRHEGKITGEGKMFKRHGSARKPPAVSTLVVV
jgi:hypothetical protein